MVKHKEYTIISTFAGGGGSSLGYHWAGFKELLAIDFDKNAVETLKANFDFPVWEADITKIKPEDILDFCKIKKGELDILDGSPPCQGFSTAGKRNLNDSRNDLFLDFIRLIEGLQPKVFVMENVSGMIKGGYKGKFNEILQTLKNTGYNVKVKLMNAMWYEVPQSRERLFFIGVRNDLKIEPSFPKPLDKITTTKEALAGLVNEAWELEFANKFQNYKVAKFWEELKDGKNHIKRFNLIKIADNKPCPTITKGAEDFWGTAWLCHNKEKRYLTVSECKRLSSFPDDYKLLGKFEDRVRRIGNAVMPKMMYHIAKNIKENILDKIEAQN